MLFVLGALLYLYVSAGASYISTWSEARHRTADLKRLKAENARLRAQKAALVKPTTVQEEARLLGMVKPGERAYVITGLPRN